MSRPGSSCSRPRSRPNSRPSSRTGSRSEVKGYNRGNNQAQGQSVKDKPQRKSPERRSLPPTPQMSDSSRSNSQDRGSRNSSIVRVDRSPDGSYRRSPSISPNRGLTSTLKDNDENRPQLLSYRHRDRVENNDYDETTMTDDVIHQAAELLFLHNSQYSDVVDDQTADISDKSGRLRRKSGRKTPNEHSRSNSADTNSSRTSKSPNKQKPNQNKPRQRPFSAEVVRPINRKPPLSNSRPATPSSFRIRSASTSGTAMKPVKALHMNDSVDATRYVVVSFNILLSLRIVAITLFEISLGNMTFVAFN